MSKEKQMQISVITIFDGKQDVQQAFIDLLIKRQQDNLKVAPKSIIGYNNSRVFSGVRVNERR